MLAKAYINDIGQSHLREHCVEKERLPTGAGITITRDQPTWYYFAQE
jgi:hypothetical protein